VAATVIARPMRYKKLATPLGTITPIN